MSEENEKIGNNSRVDETRKRINRKHLAKTCKFFAVFAVVIMVISSFAVMVKAEGDYSAKIDVNTLPYQHDIGTNGLLPVTGEQIKIYLWNASENTTLLINISNTSNSPSFYVDTVDVGSIEAGISNLFIITITDTSVLRFTDGGGHIIITKIEESAISSPSNAKITGKTFYKVNSQSYVADIGLPQTKAHNITISPDETLTYIGITQGSISKYGRINGGAAETTRLPKDSYIRLLSEHPVNFNLMVETAPGEISVEPFVTGITAYSQNDPTVFDRIMLNNIEPEQYGWGSSEPSSLWQKTTDNARWSGTSSWKCSNTEGNYNPNMNDVLLLSSIPLTVSSNPVLSFWTKYHLQGTSISYWGFPRLDLPFHDRYALFTDSEQKFILNISSTQVYTYEPITFCVSSEEEILNVTWFFGDNHIGYGCSANHSYSDNGVYTVDVIVTSNIDEITVFQATITVLNRPPVPVIDVYQIVNVTLRVAGKKNNTVTMTLMENNTAVSETSVTRQSGNPDEQSKTVSLRVKGDKNYTVNLGYNGSDGGANPVKIIVESKDVYNESNILFNSQNETYQNKTMNIDDVLEDVLKDNTEAIFNASASYDTDGYINNFVWFFGDGTSGAGMVVNHTYAVHGAYNITLNITDDDNASSNATAVVHLSEPVLSNTEYSYVDYNWKTIIIDSDINRLRLGWGRIIGPIRIITNHDNIYIEISPDNNTWNILSVYPYTGTKNSSNLYGNVDGWVKRQISFSDYTGPNVWVRFRMVSDSSIQYTAPCIDDVQIGKGKENGNGVVLTHENTYINDSSIVHIVRVKNNGNSNDTFILEATGGTLNNTLVTLSPESSTLVSLIISKTLIPESVENPYDIDNDGINNAEEFYLPYYYGKIYTKDYFDSRNITRDDSNLPVPLDVTDISNYTVLYGNNSQIKLKINALEHGVYNINIAGIAGVNDTQESRLSDPVDISLENQTGEFMVENYVNIHNYRGGNNTCNMSYWWNNYTFKAYLGKGTHNVTIGLNSSTYDASSHLVLLLDHLYIEKYGINPLSSDSDMDGINDMDEYLDCLSPCSADTDNDYIMDNVEIDYWQSNGLLLPESIERAVNPDFDNDRLVDGFELLYNTNITNPDSDNDGLNDYDEIFEYTKAERIEAEDTPLYDKINVVDAENGILLKSDDNPSFNMDFDVSEKGSYRVKVVSSSVVNTSTVPVNDSETNETTAYTQMSTGQSFALLSSDSVIASSEREIMSSNVAKGTTSISLSSDMLISEYNTGSMELKTKITDNFVEITDRRYYTIYGELEKGSHTFHYELSNSSDDSVIVTIDYFLIERNGLDPWDNDTDNDSLLDGDEVIDYGTSPWVNDSDNDGLTDLFEVTYYGTNPNEKDTDGDGISDYDEFITYRTYPNRKDSDFDGIDDKEEIDYWVGRGMTDYWAGKNATNPDCDNDTMPDGYEIKNSLDPLNPDDANYDSDTVADGLTNVQEYNLGTNISEPDTDGDGLKDGDEIISVLFRTNISYGAVRINGYQNENLTNKWIYYNSSEWVNGNEYRYNGNFTNPTNISSASPLNIWNKLILTLKDNTKIYLNTTDNNNNTIYVWESNADINDADSNGTIEGKCYQFIEDVSITVETANLPVAGYKNKEIFYGANPLKNDTDNDGVLDGKECNWNQDTDSDGIINALDRDSDNDGLTDGQEWFDDWRNNADNDSKPNMVDPDSDNDNLPDSLELMPLSDIDNDTLPNFIDADSDGDGLLDGEEDANHNGTIEENETSPIRADTDNDGLNDYNETYNTLTNPTRADTDFDGLNDGDEIGLVETDGLPNTYLTSPINPDTDNDTLLDGQEMKGWYIMVEQGAEEHLTLVTSNPLMADSDNDGLLDSEEIYNAVYWVSEAENYRTNDTQLVDNNMAVTNKTDISEIYNITLTIPNGTYQYYVRAKAGDDNNITLKINSSNVFTNEIIVVEDEYRWFSAAFNVTNRLVTLYASGSVFVDKILLVKENITVINTFSDGSYEKTLTFDSAGEQTVFISVPENTYSINATVNIGGSFVFNVTEAGYCDKYYSTESSYSQIYANGVYASGNYAYVAGYPKGLYIINISDTHAPTVAGVAEDYSAHANDIYVSGNYAYVIASDDNLTVFNVSEPCTPILTDSIAIGANLHRLYVSGNYAYVIDSGQGSRGLVIINISDPYNLTEVGCYSEHFEGGVHDSAMDVYVVGNYAYVTGFYLRLYIIDVSNHSNPTLVGFHSYDAINYHEGIYVSGNYAYVAAKHGLRIIDISNPSMDGMPGAQKSCYTTPGYAYDVYILNNYAYIADNGSGLTVINVLDPRNPTEVGGVETLGNAYGIHVSNGYAYIADSNGGLRIIDVVDYPRNIVVDIGGDGSIEYYYSGMFSTTAEIAGLSLGFNQYLPNAVVENGFAVVPIRISSDSPGKLTMLNVTINLQLFATNPFSNDTDYDGLYDGDEIQWFEKDGIPNLYPSSPADSDTDDDLLFDGKEVIGWNIIVERINDNITIFVISDPRINDTDNDDIPDFVEYKHLNASNPDTDEDGLTDNLEVILINGSYRIRTDPCDVDTDDDLMLDGGTSNETLTSLYNSIYGCDPPAEDRNNDGFIDPYNESDPLDQDTDNDGITDGTEYFYYKSNETCNYDGYCNTDSDNYINIVDYDSDNDGLLDGEENNYDSYLDKTCEADPLDWDCDDDGLLDGAEPLWYGDSDNDEYINVWDQDSNDMDNSNANGIYDLPATGDSATGNDYEQTYVVFRTDAIDNDDDGKLDYISGTWIAVDPNGANLLSPATLNLLIYQYGSTTETNPNAQQIVIEYGPSGNTNPVPLKTPEDYDVYYLNGMVYIYNGVQYIKYVSGTDTSDYKDSIHSVNSFVWQHQETYDGRPAVNLDSDFDGLSNSLENSVAGLDPNDADSDDDGVLDGNEINWNVDSDKDGFINALDHDSDSDGIFDGTEMGVTASSLRPDTDTSAGNFIADADPTTTTDPLNNDTDGDGLDDGEEDNGNGAGSVAYDGSFTLGETDPNNRDTDFDGLLDTENHPVHADWDNDGILDGDDEFVDESNNRDHDSDGILNSVEMGLVSGVLDENKVGRRYYGTDGVGSHLDKFKADADQFTRTNPEDDDTDGDGIKDGDEDKDCDGLFELNGGANGRETDPNNKDSDNDGILDGDEDWYNRGVLDSDESDPTRIDTDNDGLFDNQEDKNKNGVWNSGETCAYNPDSDGDGLWDGYNISGHWGELTLGTDPLKEDTDADGINDNIELSQSTSPTMADSDADGFWDGYTIMVDGEEHIGELSIGTDPAKIDSDNDGLSDGIEIGGWEIFIVRTDGTKTTLRVYGNPLSGVDRDGDGLNDYQEFVNCTNPDNSDTDSDGIWDDVEIEYRETNPSQYNPNIQDSLPPTVKNVKISMSEHWTSVTVTIIPSVTVSAFGYSYTTPAVTASVNIIDGISVKVTANIWDASGVYSVKFTKDSTKVDGLLVSGNTFNAGFFLGISLGSLIKLVTDITVGFTVKVKAYDYLNNWNESEGSYDGPFTVMAKIYVSMLMSAWNAWCAVGEAVKNALESLGSWMWDLITSMIDAAVSYVENAINDFVNNIAYKMKEGYENAGAVGLFVGVVDAIFNSALYWALLTIITVFLAIEIIVTALTLGGGTITGAAIINVIRPVIVGALIGAIASGISVVFDRYGDSIEAFFKSVGISTGIVSAGAMLYAKLMEHKIEGLKEGIGDLLAFVCGIIGVVLVVWETPFEPIIDLGLDIAGLCLAVYAAKQAYDCKLDLVSWVYKIGEIIGYVSLGASLADMLLKDYSAVWEGE